MIPNEKISKANSVKKVHRVYQQISDDLANIDILRYVKIYNGSIKASNFRHPSFLGLHFLQLPIL